MTGVIYLVSRFPVVPLINILMSFLISISVGGISIFLASVFVVNEWKISHAIAATIAGGILWAIAIGVGHPLAVLLILIAWVTIIDIIYPGGWQQALAIGCLAWFTSFLVLMMAESIFQLELDAFGIPAL